MKKLVSYRLTSLLWIVTLLAADFVSKAMAEAWLRGRGMVEVVGRIFVLVYTENHGAFLGMGNAIEGFPWILLFVILPLGVVIAVIAILMKRRPSNALLWGYILIIAGGIGNLSDRIFREGMVRDFLNFGVGRLRTGVLNIADLYVTIGAVLLIIVTGFSGSGKSAPADPPHNGTEKRKR